MAMSPAFPKAAPAPTFFTTTCASCRTKNERNGAFHMVHSKRWLALSTIVLIVVALFAFVTFSGSPPSQGGEKSKSTKDEWVMFGGTPSRNMVNPHANNLPVK